MIGGLMPKHRQDLNEAEEPSLEQDFYGLFTSTRAAFDSEIAYQKARAALAAKLVMRIAGLVALAWLCVFCVDGADCGDCWALRHGWGLGPPRASWSLCC
jgi:hypothetical protein